jgi:hypothetical protein
MAAISGAKSYGKDSVVDPAKGNRNPSWIKIAQNTVDDILEEKQTDNKCGGK